MTENSVNKERTIDEIIAEHASKTAEIMNNYLDQTSRIREETTPEDGRYLDRLGSEERLALLYQQKVAKADEAYTSARAAYEAETSAFHAAHAARVEALESTLFRVDDADAAARAAVASEDELASMLSYARLSGNKDLAKAAFVASHSRDAGHLVGRYFETDPDARAPYEEYEHRVPQEVLSLQNDVGRVVQPPDLGRLMPPARARA